MARIHVYCCVPTGALRDAVALAMGDAVEFLDPPFRAARLAGRDPGVVLLDVEGMPAEELVQATAMLPPPDWVLALFMPGDEPTVRTLSLSPRDDLAAVAARVGEPDAHREVLLEIHRILAEVARARHDINNPLTSALAETQILLLDVEERETREALDTVQTQLRRIRDLVASTRHIRPRE